MPSFLCALLCVSILAVATSLADITQQVDIFDVTNDVLGMDKAVFEGPLGKGPRKNLFSLMPQEHRAKYDQLKKESKDASELISNLIRNAYDVAVKGKNGKEALQGIQMQFNALSSEQKKKLLSLFPSLKSFYGHHSSQGSTSTEGPNSEIDIILEKEKWSLQRAEQLLEDVFDRDHTIDFSETIASLKKLIRKESRLWTADDFENIIKSFKKTVDGMSTRLENVPLNEDPTSVIEKRNVDRTINAFKRIYHVFKFKTSFSTESIDEKLENIDTCDAEQDRLENLSRIIGLLSLK